MRIHMYKLVLLILKCFGALRKTNRNFVCFIVITLKLGNIRFINSKEHKGVA